MRTIAIDTGKTGCGVAAFDGPRLVAAAYPQAKDALWFKPGPCSRLQTHAYTVQAMLSHYRELSFVGTPEGTARVIIEFPRIYRGRELEKDQNDLLDLAAVAGRLCAELELLQTSTLEFLHVSDWKGQMTKEAAWHHTQKALTHEEKAVYVRAVEDLPKKLHHNVQDAIGIGLWVVGRFGR